ncbi:hypothetical protein HK102_009170 [Quaeritorhiza haematococci]|nr:hypothetical protein HK102_009170 [Quaeritorhiza haematococci]
MGLSRTGKPAPAVPGTTMAFDLSNFLSSNLASQPPRTPPIDVLNSPIPSSWLSPAPVPSPALSPIPSPMHSTPLGLGFEETFWNALQCEDPTTSAALNAANSSTADALLQQTPPLMPIDESQLERLLFGMADASNDGMETSLAPPQQQSLIDRSPTPSLLSLAPSPISSAGSPSESSSTTFLGAPSLMDSPLLGQPASAPIQGLLAGTSTLPDLFIPVPPASQPQQQQTCDFPSLVVPRVEEARRAGLTRARSHSSPASFLPESPLLTLMSPVFRTSSPVQGVSSLKASTLDVSPAMPAISVPPSTSSPLSTSATTSTTSNTTTSSTSPYTSTTAKSSNSKPSNPSPTPQFSFIETTFSSTSSTSSPTPHEKYKCPHPGCERQFALMRSLLSHQLSHSDDRPYACPDCDVRFRRLPDLQRHVRSLHSQGAKPYPCPHGCGKSFPRSDALRRHLAVKSKSSKFSCRALQGQGEEKGLKSSSK